MLIHENAWDCTQPIDEQVLGPTIVVAKCQEHKKNIIKLINLPGLNVLLYFLVTVLIGVHMRS